MRLLIFSPYFEPHVGGIESYVSELNDALLHAQAVEQITVVTPQLPPTALSAEERRPGYRIFRYPAVEVIPNFPLPRIWTADFWRTIRSARLRRADVLVSHTRFFISSALALAFARLTGKPLIHVEHGSDFVQLGSYLNRTIARGYDHLFGRIVLRRADATVAVSHAASAFVSRLAGRRACGVIHRGISAARLESAIPDKEVLEYANGRKVITYVGRLIDGKGVADLLRAFAELREEDAVLCLVGDGPRRRDLTELASATGTADLVLFLGNVGEQRSLATILASDIVVNPSYTEGLPTAVLEAALLGRAVIATDVGGTSEVLPDGGGILVRPGDPAALACELRRLLREPRLRSQLGLAAQSFAKAKFDWTKSAPLFLAVAASLVTSPEAVPVDVPATRSPEGNQ